MFEAADSMSDETVLSWRSESMATFALRRFSCPETLKAIAPATLLYPFGQTILGSHASLTSGPV
jgi:hypothetical protein